MRKKAAIFLLLLILLCIPAAAHSGGTDENGGHIDHSTGEYHYHHGYPAHQHDGGVCPYNFVDKSGSTSGGSGSSKSSGSAVKAPAAQKQSKDELSGIEAALAVLGIAFVFSSLPTIGLATIIERNFTAPRKVKVMLTAASFELVTAIGILIIAPDLLYREATIGLAIAVLLIAAIKAALSDDEM